jgi:hypothetical protein
MAALHKVRRYTGGDGIGISFDLPTFAATDVDVGVSKLKSLIEASERQSRGKVRLVVLDNLIGMLRQFSI